MEHSYPASGTAATADRAAADTTSQTPIYLSQQFLAFTLIALGVLGFIHGDVALVWQHLPIQHLPGEKFIAYAFALIELVTGLGLLLRRWMKPASILLVAFMLMWTVLLKLPGVIAAPLMEATWLGFGEIAVILAGAWVLFALNVGERSHGLRGITGARGVRAARVLFALSLPMIGLSHFFYSEQTVALVPAWLPYHLGWAYLTGAGSIAACLAVLFGVVPQLAARLEAVMLWIITLLVWVPAIVAAHTDRTAWTALVISAAIASGAWVVADSYRSVPYLGRSS